MLLLLANEICRGAHATLTLRVVLVGVLEVVLHRLLPDHLLNLPLSVDVERVFIKKTHLLHPLAFPTLVLAHHVRPDLAEAVAVVDGLGQSGSLFPHLRHGVCISQYAQSRPLDVGRRALLLSLLSSHVGLLLLLGWLLSWLPLLLWLRQQYQHVIVLHARLFQCFRVWLEDGVVEVEGLLVLRKVGLCVDESLEVQDCEAGWEVEVEELLIEGMVGRDDRYGDPRPGGGSERSVHVSCCMVVTQTRSA